MGMLACAHVIRLSQYAASSRSQGQPENHHLYMTPVNARRFFCSFTLDVIFPGRWPKRPIALLGTFIRLSKQLNETKAKAKGNLIVLQLFRRHSMCSRILLCTFILSYVVFFPDDETWQHLSAVIGRCTAGHAHIFHSFLTTYAILIKFIGGVTN